MKNLFKKQKKAAGFTLIEMIITISILSFGVMLVYQAFFWLVSSSYIISNRFTAAYLAQEGVEIIRNLRDNNFITISQNPLFQWNAEFSTCSDGCMADYKTQTASLLVPYDGSFLGLNGDGLYDHDVGSTPTIFKREITISPVSGTDDVLYVDVLVTWSYNSQSYSFNTAEYLYNWY